MGPVGSQVGTSGSRMGPFFSRTLMRDSRVIRQSPSGPVGPYRVPTGFRRNPVLARQDPTIGSIDRSTVPYRCTIDVRTPWARHGVPTGPPEPRRDPFNGPPADRRGHRRTPFNRRLPGLGGPPLLLASASVLVFIARGAHFKALKENGLFLEIGRDEDATEGTHLDGLQVFLAFFGHTF